MRPCSAAFRCGTRDARSVAPPGALAKGFPSNECPAKKAWHPFFLTAVMRECSLHPFSRSWHGFLKADQWRARSCSRLPERELCQQLSPDDARSAFLLTDPRAVQSVASPDGGMLCRPESERMSGRRRPQLPSVIRGTMRMSVSSAIPTRHRCLVDQVGRFLPVAASGAVSWR